MKIYVAAASKELERAKNVMCKLRGFGHTITHDWTVEVEKYKNEIPSDDILTQCAENDYQGVFSATALVLLSPEIQNITIGAWTELGVALALHKTIFISGNADKCIFSYMGDVHKFDNDEELLFELQGW